MLILSAIGNSRRGYDEKYMDTVYASNNWDHVYSRIKSNPGIVSSDKYSIASENDHVRVVDYHKEPG